MVNTLLGIKKNMTSTYDARGRRVAATILQVQPNFVIRVKTSDSKDGYNAVQLGMGKKKSLKKPVMGQLKKAGIEENLRWLRETRTAEAQDLEPGKTLTVGQVFSVGDTVKVTGVSKGRGFQGGVKRYNFAGGPKTHGQSDRHRAPGSIGSGTTPGRVYKGKRMAGHYGVDTKAALNLEVVGMDKNNNTLTVKGAVPGFSGGLVTITKLGRVKGYTPPPEPEEEEEVVVEENNDSEQIAVESPVVNEEVSEQVSETVNAEETTDEAAAEETTEVNAEPQAEVEVVEPGESEEKA